MQTLLDKSHPHYYKPSKVKPVVEKREKVKKERKRLCGVYVIEFPRVKKVYVGQSVNIINRWCQHRSVLRKGTCQNEDLQMAWNLYSKSSEFRVIEECSQEELTARERAIAEEYLKRDWSLLNMYFQNETVNLLFRKEHKSIFLRIAKMLDRGQISIDDLGRILDSR